MCVMMKNESASRGVSGRIPRDLREKATRILAERHDFIDSDEFRRRNIEAELFTGDCEPELPSTAWYQPTADDIDVDLSRSPHLMKANEERLMFLRYNYAKRRLRQLQKRVRKTGLTRRAADEAVLWKRRCDHYREYLVRSNLALVLAMAKRTRLGQCDFSEVVSEGNMALLRAVDKFNVDKGFKFSTYACRAILKAFSRTSVKTTRHRSRFPVEFEPDLERSDWIDRRREMVEAECIDELKNILSRNLAELTPTEATVIRQRFNWDEQNESPLTLEEVGKIIGVTKERVRQIQNKALAKIRQVMEDGVLRTQVTREMCGVEEPTN